MRPGETDVVKQQVAAHWDRRAAHFDEERMFAVASALEGALGAEAHQ